MNGYARIFAEWFGMNEQPGRVLAILFHANGGAVSHEELCGRLGIRWTALRSAVVRMRAAMDEGSYLCLQGVGYRLTDIGLADCRAALADFNQRKAAA